MMSDTDHEQSNGSGVAGDQVEYRLVHIYLKDVSLETPNTPDIFVNPRKGKPEMTMDLTYHQNEIDPETHEVVLHIRVGMEVEGISMFLAEVYQAAIVVMKGFSREDAHRQLGVVCPAELFPYAREALSSLVNRGGFPTLMLQPVNFEQIYLQSLNEKKADE
jgi:preprotein translocase subunit SecB